MIRNRKDGLQKPMIGVMLIEQRSKGKPFSHPSRRTLCVEVNYMENLKISREKRERRGIARRRGILRKKVKF